jgi:hypothetical protein
MTEARVDLKLNELNQVIASWRFEGGCPPFEGTLTAWYQDEMKPSTVFAVDEASGRVLDPPIIHKGYWDRDYYLDVTDAAGRRVHAFATITIGH